MRARVLRNARAADEAITRIVCILGHDNRQQMQTLTGTGPFNFADDAEWQSVDTGVSRKVMGYDRGIMMVLVRFEAGAVGALHHHEHRQVSYVASGRFEATIDGEKTILKAGDGYLVRPNLVHGVVALEAGMLVDVFSPAREDFIG
jgi:quercetin dioxygenase-like cupin family protein